MRSREGRDRRAAQRGSDLEIRKGFDSVLGGIGERGAPRTEVEERGREPIAQPWHRTQQAGDAPAEHPSHARGRALSEPRLTERGKPLKQRGEWLAFKVSWVNDYIKGPEDSPYVPAVRRLPKRRPTSWGGDLT